MAELLRPGMKVHLVGIGGIGLSAIARVLNGLGYEVSGSDREPSALTETLKSEGIRVFSGHRAESVTGAELVVVSAAVPESNPEVIEARRLGITVIKRERILDALTAQKTVVAVAGTHGKTTTSAMIAWILRQSDLDPTFIVGGVLQNLGTNAGAGTGPHFVVEADEYDRTFLGLHPSVAVVTTLEHDHPDCYPTFEEMRTAFAEFADQVVAEGLLIVCGQDPEAMRLGLLAESKGRRVATYGFDRRFDWWAEGAQLGSSAVFSVGRNTPLGNGHGSRNGRVLETCALQVPGAHNVLNALASLAASAELGVDVGTAAAALTRFRGAARRFEIKGQISGITVVDDYAHHPTEIRATLAAARLKFPGRPIWAVFQPHTYSRTAALLEDFAAAFGDADHVIITGIYAARERDTLGIGGDAILSQMHHPDAEFVAGIDDAAKRLLGQLSSGDVVITLGAGDGYLIGEQILIQLERARTSSAEDHG